MLKATSAAENPTTGLYSVNMLSKKSSCGGFSSRAANQPKNFYLYSAHVRPKIEGGVSAGMGKGGVSSCKAPNSKSIDLK